jgi:hypothetical protein
VQTFIRAGEVGLSLDEISYRWESRFDSAYSRRTFNNHREAVEDVFGIRIECNRSTNKYFIEAGNDVSDANAESAWLINTFTVNNMLSLGKERLSGRVSVDDIPSGHKHLTSIMEAMTENCEIVIDYRKYTSEETSTYTLRPYAVKESEKRWYLVAIIIVILVSVISSSISSSKEKKQIANFETCILNSDFDNARTILKSINFSNSYDKYDLALKLIEAYTNNNDVANAIDIYENFTSEHCNCYYMQYDHQCHG